MAKRYIYKVIYGNKLIDKIDIVVEDKDIADEEVNTIALDRFRVEFEEVIEEE